MKKEKYIKKPTDRKRDIGEEKKLVGYPLYPASEDVYGQPNPDNPELKRITKKNGDVTGIDLDVPGAELDDDQENIGNEDEENNYYSLGGDDHNDLDEDNGEEQ